MAYQQKRKKREGEGRLNESGRIKLSGVGGFHPMGLPQGLSNIGRTQKRRACAQGILCGESQWSSSSCSARLRRLMPFACRAAISQPIRRAYFGDEMVLIMFPS